MVQLYIRKCKKCTYTISWFLCIEFANNLTSNGYVSGEDYKYAWLDIEYNPKSSCDWAGYSGTANCQYVGQLISALESYGIAVGLYALILHLHVQVIQIIHYRDDASFGSWSRIPFGG